GALLVGGRFRLRGRLAGRSVGRADLQIESFRCCRVIALVAGGVDVAAAPGVDARRQPALLELRLHLIGIERRDAERDVADAGLTRRRARARAAVAAAAAPDADVAAVADLGLALAAFALAGPPSKQRDVEPDALL